MTRDEQVAHIVELMSGAGDGWHGTKTARELAAAWGVSVRQVLSISHDAGQRMRGAQESIGAAALIQAKLAELDSLKERALSHETTVVVGRGEDAEAITVPRPDFRVALDAVEFQIRVLGGNVQGAAAVGKGATGKSSQRGEGAGGEAPLPRAELIRRTREALAQLEAEEQTEGKGMH